MPPAAVEAGAWTTLLGGLDGSDAGAAALFARVRDLPFRFAPHRDAETLLATGGGTCAPKHALLARAYAALGRETRFVYVSFRFDDMPGNFPADLRTLAHDGVVRAHAALQLRRDDAWLDVDATFDRPLAGAGFVVTEHWDGCRPMPLVVSPLARVESTKGPEHEEALLGLPERSGFPRAVVTRLNAWLDTLRHP